MPSLRNAFSSLSSSSSSPSDSPLKQDSKDNSFFKNWGGSGSGSKRRLTRQRKLRHVSGVGLGLQLSDQSQSLPVSPDSGSRSPSNLGHWSASAVPQPLPLPDDRSNSRLPKEGPSRGEGDGRDKTGGANPSSSATGSYFAHQTIRKTTDHVATKSSKSPTYRRRGFPQDLNIESVHHNFRLNVPARSAPTSGFSSPAVSPQRFSSVNIFHSSFAVSREFQVSSALEVSVDRLAGSSSQVSPARITCSADHSPLHSPTIQSPCRNTRSPNDFVLHSHHKSLPENSTTRPDGNSHANVHPLPLPPGVSKPSHSTTIRHIMEKPDISLMKGQWQKGKCIGSGTYGTVYVATNRETGALCAMKEVNLIRDDTKSAECINQLEQEIKVLQHLKHPNIVQYYGSEVVEDRFCIYLEYVHPGSINNYVREHCRAVTESVVRNFTRHILSGLAYLHSTKTIHRDIKGANLLVDSSGVVKLADFGLAKHLTGHFTDLSLKGSPHWMAPEVLQAVMRKDTNPELAFAVDIWSLGCTVIEMLNGQPPWSEFSGVQAMFNVLNKSPPIPETLSSEGKDFLRWCFQRNPADRPSANKLLDHPFLRNSHDQNVSVCMQEFSGMKLMESSHSPRDWTRHVKDLMPISPGIQIRHAKLPCSGESCPQSYPETSDTPASSRHSPRSTLEVLPSISSPELNCSSHNISLFPNVSNSFLLGAGNNHPHVFLRTHGREIPHF
uniref:mitogen-activated protein kinase kinase kinase n=1 Tax=Davidia involucrata TaxID=16924 RepID=A0A5B7BNT4_DAVIN